MKRSFLFLFALCGVPAVHGGDVLKAARSSLLRGNYIEAREQYEALLKDGKFAVAAAIGVSKTHEAVGEYVEAQKVIEAALKGSPKEPSLLARYAELLYLRGQLGEAAKVAQQAIDVKEDNFLARWIQAQIIRDSGEWDKAEKAFRWLVRKYSERENNCMPITDPDELRVIGLAGLENARLNHITDQFEFILQEIFDFSFDEDKQYWPAQLEAGRLYLEKFNKAAAHRALDKALIVNPRAAEALAAKGIAAMQRFETKEAEHLVEQALKINPALTEALRLRADVSIFANDFPAALKDLEKARSINPRDERTLGMLAAMQLMRREDKAFKEIVAEVEKHNPKAAIFYYELADNLDRRKYYHEAEKFYDRSIALEPRLPWALNGLGQLYMRLGKEDIAQKLLERAFKADEFNLRVDNTLIVLKHLESYETLRTDHFILRYHKKTDAVLARVMAKYLEDVYQELAAKFDYKPMEPILIQVFNRHDMFSGRVVQLPDLHTIGACTGKMIAMVSPKGVPQPFNWVRVIRHELVHVFNLEQTKFRIPHWYTEGLAVLLEGSGPPPRWNNLVATKMQEKDLLNLDTVLLGFIRPRSPEQWDQAYMQSLLYVQYMMKRYGDKAIGQLLAAYEEGLETEAALAKAFKVDKADFEKGYLTFLEERLPKEIVKAGPVFPSLRAIKEAYEKDPMNPELTALLAERYYNLGNRKEARALADKALGLKKFHPRAVYVKAMVLTEEGNPDTAFDLLTTAIDEKSDDIKPLSLLGRLHFERSKFAESAKMYERCRELDPFEPSWLTLLSRAYSKEGNEAKLLTTLKAIVETNPDDLATRKQAAKLSQKIGNHADVAKYAKQALEIDVLDAQAQEMLLEALTAQGKMDEANMWKKLLEK